jgi:hypothetical protein
MAIAGQVYQLSQECTSADPMTCTLDIRQKRRHQEYLKKVALRWFGYEMSGHLLTVSHPITDPHGIWARDQFCLGSEDAGSESFRLRADQKLERGAMGIRIQEFRISYI